jgi:IS5 family transposase
VIRGEVVHALLQLGFKRAQHAHAGGEPLAYALDIAFTRAIAEFADALDLCQLGDGVGMKTAAERGLAALESAEALDARYCRGKWADWHKCRVQVPLPKIIEHARDLIKIVQNSAVQF